MYFPRYIHSYEWTVVGLPACVKRNRNTDSLKDFNKQTLIGNGCKFQSQHQFWLSQLRVFISILTMVWLVPNGRTVSFRFVTITLYVVLLHSINNVPSFVPLNPSSTDPGYEKLPNLHSQKFLFYCLQCPLQYSVMYLRHVTTSDFSVL